jgi:hypothetical protein
LSVKGIYEVSHVPKSYLFPIPNEEYKKDPDLGQNPGWEIKTTGDSATVQ